MHACWYIFIGLIIPTVHHGNHPHTMTKASMLACFHSSGSVVNQVRSGIKNDQIGVLHPSCIVAFVNTNNKCNCNISHITEDNNEVK